MSAVEWRRKSDAAHNLMTVQCARAATFNAATIGMHAWTIAKTFNRMRPGCDFRGLTKASLREVFVSGELANKPGSELRRFLSTSRG